MGKRVTHELTYDAPLAAIVDMLTDAAFREEVCDAQGVLRHNVTVTRSPAGTEVGIDQVQRGGGLPSFARTIVGDEIHIVHQETWTSPDHAEIEVSIPGKPGHMRGTATLAESDGVTTETVDLEVSVHIPLVGGKVEGLIADNLHKALTVENKVGRRYLTRT